MVACGGLGVVIERFAYRPLRTRPAIAPLISALGVSFFCRTARCSSSARASGLRHLPPDRREDLQLRDIFLSVPQI
jgi:branched-subunit amino acid ABC-type transport system permease component